MVRKLEVGDKVTVQPFIGEPYIGKITKIGSAIIYVELLKIGSRPLVGSSKINILGLFINDAAIPRRSFIPSE